MSVNTKVNGQLVKSAGLYKASVPIQSGDIYSFEERQVGVYADGKPLYQKTLYIASLPASKSTGTYSLNVSNAENCWVVDANSGTGNLNMIRIAESSVNDMQSASIYARCGVVDGDVKVYVEVGRDRSSMSAYVTVRYTKTTDVAGSGEYVPSGDKAVHYSTDEEVIGTWLGETLYRKVIPITENWEFVANAWVKSNIPKGDIKALINGRIEIFYNNTHSLHFIQLDVIDNMIAGNSFRQFQAIANGSNLILEYTKTSS